MPVSSATTAAETAAAHVTPVAIKKKKKDGVTDRGTREMGKEEVVAGHREQTNGQELLKKLLCNWGGGDERECWRTARTERILKSI